jgi:hypothetical protein
MKTRAQNGKNNQLLADFQSVLEYGFYLVILGLIRELTLNQNQFG